MTTIVTDNCKDCRFTDCVSVCPVACFHNDDEMLYIDPDVCIDCSACIPECPVQAIFEDDDIPEDKEEWIAINAERAPQLPVCDEQMEPLPCHYFFLLFLGRRFTIDLLVRLLRRVFKPFADWPQGEEG